MPRLPTFEADTTHSTIARNMPCMKHRVVSVSSLPMLLLCPLPW